MSDSPINDAASGESIGTSARYRGMREGPYDPSAQPMPETKNRRHVPDPGRIALVSHEDNMVLRARLDDGYPLFFGGYGGWEDEPRPGKVSATVFRGASAPQLKVRMILGNWPVRPVWATDCARAMNMLEHFARIPVDGHRRDRPSLLWIRGHVPHHDRRWFIQDIEWGDVDLVRGKRARATVTVTLRMYVPVELLKRRDRVARPTKTYKIRRGQSLDRFVMAHMGVKGTRMVRSARARVLRLNGLRRGAKIEPGTRLKVPVGSWWEKAEKGR